MPVRRTDECVLYGLGIDVELRMVELDVLHELARVAEPELTVRALEDLHQLDVAGSLSAMTVVNGISNRRSMRWGRSWFSQRETPDGRVDRIISS